MSYKFHLKNKTFTANNEYELRAGFVGFKMALVEWKFALHRLRHLYED